MRTIILLITMLVSVALFSQNADQSNLPEKTEFYFVAMGGAIYGRGEPVLAAGLKFGFAKTRVGRIGPRIVFSVPVAHRFALSIIDYDYPVQITKGFHFVPNIGLGYTQDTYSGNGYYSPDKYSYPVGFFGINGGLSLEVMPAPWLGITAGANGMIGFSKNSSTFSLTGGFVFIL
ncbi:MAG: hypothetical protein GXO89_16910 [Chlorobi bacterium]|nr:hypothetical protein [Chlorobiota bacterium]